MTTPTTRVLNDSLKKTYICDKNVDIYVIAHDSFLGYGNLRHVRSRSKDCKSKYCLYTPVYHVTQVLSYKNRKLIREIMTANLVNNTPHVSGNYLVRHDSIDLVVAR